MPEPRATSSRDGRRSPVSIPGNSQDPQLAPFELLPLSGLKEAPLYRFRDGLPYRPYCSDDLSTGLVIRGRDLALRCRYIQHSPPVLYCWLAFDIDRSGGVLAWEEANLPPPHISIRTTINQHGQLLYGLLVPVCTSDAARQGPLRLAAAIERAYTELLEADRSYSGQIVKNPFHPDWATECRLRPLYELHELAVESTGVV